ncbi:hypothetical protein LIER_07909 [Lithospermum erythrorhizon]|uniref:SHSP domain-containing protein n=1 Tax=Lithospermum erythrorhizon TaxID=34254 RepID=A0AAV3P9U6_LITER
MDVTKKSTSGATPIYEDFVPTSKFVTDKDCDTLLIHLPGFKKEQLRVQLTRGILMISGSIPVGNNKRRRFQKEFPVSTNCETNKITARFENGVLHVKQPKLITPATPSVKSEQDKLPPKPRQPTPIPSSAPHESNKPAIKPHAMQNVAENGDKNKEGKETDKGKQTCCAKNETNMDQPSRNEEKTEGKDKVSTRKEDYGVNTIVENYQKMVRAMGQRLKMQRRVVHVVLTAVLGCLVAIYVNNLITSRQPTN